MSASLRLLPATRMTTRLDAQVHQNTDRGARVSLFPRRVPREQTAKEPFHFASASSESASTRKSRRFPLFSFPKLRPRNVSPRIELDASRWRSSTVTWKLSTSLAWPIFLAGRPADSFNWTALALVPPRTQLNSRARRGGGLSSDRSRMLAIFLALSETSLWPFWICSEIATVL